MWSLWLKDLAAGRDPRPLSVEMAGAAFLQGGGLGIWGDFMLADVNRYGGGIAGTSVGPVVERGGDLVNLTAGNLIQLAAGEDTNFVEELRRFAGGMIPGSTLWYFKLGYQRIGLDQLEFYTDPRANRQFKQRQRYWQKHHRTGHWWGPGQTAPARTPEFDVLR
jgi:hypothetical protein